MKKKLNIDVDEYKLIDKTTPFAIKEAFNHLRTNLTYIPSDDDGCPIFGITSAMDSVGKSTIISNLALSFAQADTKVLLIDSDIRRPVIYKFFNLAKERHGLTELISGIEKDDAKLITQYEQAPSLHILTSGFVPHNPSELISSKKFSEYLKKWKHEYDIILIDFPPVGIVTDALAVSNDITGYFLVVRANRSDSRSVNSAISTLEQVNAKILGVILNDLSLKNNTSSRYHYTRRSYKYYTELTSTNKESK